MFNAGNGFIYGPYFSNGAYKVAKLIDARVSPDSVKARHILINPATEGGADKALAKADSLKKVLTPLSSKLASRLNKEDSTKKQS